MFYLRYLIAELRRRPGRTVLTALGLSVGVGLVVVVGALSTGLDDAQSQALEPLTGVGTDMRVTRPLTPGSSGSDFTSLSAAERRRLLKENPQGGLHLDPAELGEPGQPFSKDETISSELSFPESAVKRVARLRGASDAAPALSLQSVRISGTVPPPGTLINPHGGGYDISSTTVTGVDVDKPKLAPVTPGQISRGRYFSRSRHTARRETVLDLGYARRHGIAVGDRTRVAGRRFTVAGLATPPLGGTASNAYVELGRLQQISKHRGRANVMLVRARSTAAIGGLARAIRRDLPGADVVTASDLAHRVGGSLVDAKSLSSKLGTALAVVALAAAFLIAALLALSSVQKRIRELGTLKALGWRSRLVVRQVGAESVAQGLLGGVAGAALGIAATAIVNALDLTLNASVASARSGGFQPFGQGDVKTGSADVALGAPLDPALLAVAVALAVLGGLLAGAVGGMRAARLRPADALRSVE